MATYSLALMPSPAATKVLAKQGGRAGHGCKRHWPDKGERDATHGNKQMLGCQNGVTGTAVLRRRHSCQQRQLPGSDATGLVPTAIEELHRGTGEQAGMLLAAGLEVYGEENPETVAELTVCQPNRRSPSAPHVLAIYLTLDYVK